VFRDTRAVVVTSRHRRVRAALVLAERAVGKRRNMHREETESLCAIRVVKND
jgi:hypothetical protein